MQDHIHIENIYSHNEFSNINFLILSGPSAGGKTFLSKKVSALTDKTTLLIKHTDRKPREGEIDGLDYFFVSTSSFKKILSPENAMVSVLRYGHLYGLSCQEVKRALSSNSIPLFILDPHAAIKFKNIYNHSTLIFVGPSIDIAKERLFNRPEDDSEKAKRITLIESEYALINQFDYVLNNEYSEKDLKNLIGIINKGETI